MDGIGPRLPLTVDDVDGHFSLIKTLPDEIQQNLVNIIMTSPGEKTMDGNFGVGIRNYLFEQLLPQTSSRIQSNILTQTKKYMPFVNIQEILFNVNETQNLLGIKITYNVPNVVTRGVLLLDLT